MSQYWSWMLTAGGVFGLWLAGRKNYWGWGVGIAMQAVWIAYATATHQWGFYVSALAYGGVYLKNLLRWRREANQEPTSGAMSTKVKPVRGGYASDPEIAALPQVESGPAPGYRGGLPASQVGPPARTPSDGIRPRRPLRHGYRAVGENPVTKMPPPPASITRSKEE